MRRGGARGCSRNPEWLRPARPHGRRARRRRRDGAADGAAALGRARWSAVDLPRARAVGAGARRRPARRRDPGGAGRRTRRRRDAGPAAPAPTWSHDVPAVADWLAGAGRAAGARQLRLRRRRDQRAGVDGGRRPHRAPAGATAPTLALAFLATPTDVFAVPGRGGGARPTRALRDPAARGQAARPAAADAVGRPAAAPQLRAGRRPGHQRQPGRRSRGRTTRWPSGCSGGGRRSRADGGDDGVDERGAADAHPVGAARTGRWPRRTPARTGSASRCSSRRPATC